MTASRNLETPVGIKPVDIYFVVFRHKWKILVLTVLGLAAAAVYHFTRQPLYQSQAELLIQYVPATTAMSLAGSDQRIVVPDARGEDIINSEILILTSLDLAEQVATNFGAAKILPKAGSNAVAYAAAFIHYNLAAEPATKGGSVIAVTLKHPNQLVVQPLLQEIIDDYFQKHREIHAGGQYDAVLSAERAELSVQLNDTEQELANLKNRASVISLDDSRKGLTVQMSQLQAVILAEEAELAGYEAAAKERGQVSAIKAESTNAPAAVPLEQTEIYRDVCARLEQFRKQKRDYLGQGYTSSNTLVQEADLRIEGAQKVKSDMEAKYPQIAGLEAASRPWSNTAATAPEADPQTQAAQIAALQAKLKAELGQMEQLQLQASNLNTLAPAIARLEQTRAILQANYQSLATKLENSHIDKALDNGTTPNIKWVQTPTPPYQDWKKTNKAMAMLAFGGLLAGLAWAFLIEFYFDRTVKRAVDLQAKLHIPFFLSIPDLNHGRSSRLGSPERRRLAFNGHDNGRRQAESGAGAGSLVVAPLKVNHALSSHCDALRDRLVNYFESVNLTRKPKLVAVTSASAGAGVSTISAGLAASLSETGDGRVLLVDMNLENGAAQQFIHGQPGCHLDDALAVERRDHALVQENLYVVSEGANADKLPRILPKRFSSLIPKLRASDYDYIIFDMPPVTQTSITTRLAGFMDAVMFVIESEKTDRDVVQQANQLLVESKANVAVVLNKTRKYVPHFLQHDIQAGV